MKITIIPADNIIIVNGDARHPDNAPYPQGMRAVQWDNNEGFVETQFGQQYFDSMDYVFSSSDPEVTPTATLQTFIALHAAAKVRDETPPEEEEPEEPVPLTLVELKAQKNLEINAWRLTANFTTFEHAGKIFSCDPLSRSDIDGTNGVMTLVNDFPPNWPGGWKAINNTYIPITTRAEWEAFYLSFCATGANNFAHAQQLKAALAAATTPEQVAAIVW